MRLGRSALLRYNFSDFFSSLLVHSAHVAAASGSRGLHSLFLDFGYQGEDSKDN
jgi:hypothetical protein